jgi:AraC-like DNA-binding protein
VDSAGLVAAWPSARGFADLPPGYREWPAPAPLRHVVSCLWAQVSTEHGDREGLVLPDACSDLIWERGKGAYVAGPDTGPVPTRMPAGTLVLGVRFRPSAGGPVLGVPMSELRDQRVDLTDLRRGDAMRLQGTLDLDTALARVLDVAGALVADARPDPAASHAARLLLDPQARVEDVAAEVGLSLRQLRRRCHATAGYGPKTLQRILRFRRFVARIDARSPDRPGGLQPPGLAAIAAEAGYADQAHLTRECRQLAGLTPAALARQRIPEQGVIMQTRTKRFR